MVEGTLILTKNKMELVDATQIRGRIDARYLEGDKSSSASREESGIGGSLTQRGGEAPAAISIPLESIASMTFELAFGKPSLFLKWNESGRTFGRTRKIQFIQRGKSFPSGRRLSSWIPLIDELTSKNETTNFEEEKENELVIESEGTPVAFNSRRTTGPREIDSKKLEEELLGVLDQKEWKGLFQILKDIRDQYGSDYDFDDIEAICRKLTQRNVLLQDVAGDFYKKT